eukprot:821167-Rhodomonas_salina.1
MLCASARLLLLLEDGGGEERESGGWGLGVSLGIQGFVIETSFAGGHNAPPRGFRYDAVAKSHKLALNDKVSSPLLSSAAQPRILSVLSCRLWLAGALPLQNVPERERGKSECGCVVVLARAHASVCLRRRWGGSDGACAMGAGGADLRPQGRGGPGQVQEGC